MPKLTDFLKERAAQSEAPRPKAPKTGVHDAWYKVNGMTVHADGRDLPRPCVHCRGISELLCDFPVAEGVTCDAPLCPACAKEIGKDRHLCPLHVKVLENRKGSLL